MAASRLFFTAELDPVLGGTPRFTEWAYFCGWNSSHARDAFLADDRAMRPFLADADEHWTLALETARVVQGDWRSWRPNCADVAPLSKDEPVAVLTYGKVRTRYLPAFTWHNRRVTSVMAGSEDVIMKFGLGDTPMARATFSVWRNKGALVRFAYARDAVHEPIQRRSLSAPWADDYFFARFRPVASSGSWGGDDPLAACNLPALTA